MQALVRRLRLGPLLRVEAQAAAHQPRPRRLDREAIEQFGEAVRRGRVRAGAVLRGEEVRVVVHALCVRGLLGPQEDADLVQRGLVVVGLEDRVALGEQAQQDDAGGPDVDRGACLLYTSPSPRD